MCIRDRLWIWVGLIALIKVVNVISGFVMKKGFASKHTIANKATGVLLFLLPMMIQHESIKVPSIILVCILASSLQYRRDTLSGQNKSAS